MAQPNVYRIQERTQLTTTLVELTPELAANYLATSRGNRDIMRATVERFSRDMSSGFWHLNGDTIRFDTGGHLVDGHHRCHAVIHSGVTIQALVTRGIAPDAVTSIDSGVARSVADRLFYSNDENVRALLEGQHGKLRKDVAAGINAIHMTAFQRQASVDQTVAFIAQHSRSVAFALGISDDKEFRRAYVLGAVILTHMSQPEFSGSFWARVGSGEMLTQKDPEFHLRDYILRKCKVAAGNTSRTDPRTHSTYKCLNAARIALGRGEMRRLMGVKTYGQIADAVEFWVSKEQLRVAFGQRTEE